MPRCKEAADGLIEYSQHRVGSPLVVLTVKGTTQVLGYYTHIPAQTCHSHVTTHGLRQLGDRNPRDNR